MTRAGDELVEIRRIDRSDRAGVVAAQHLFDGPAEEEATMRFLSASDHHLLIAYCDERPIGFVSGVELTHPDKGTEMLLYELGVDEACRRRGFARALVDSLSALARDRGCRGMFVVVDRDNAAALATYRSAGAREAARPAMLEWDFLPVHRGHG